MKTLIIQTSPCHTASTMLVNALYGMIPDMRKRSIVGTWNKQWEKLFKKDVMVIKSHITDIDSLIDKYGGKYNLYFVCSERKEKNNPKYMLDPKYKEYPNLVVFDYSELNATEENPLKYIIKVIHRRLSATIPLKFYASKGAARVTAMNNRYEEIKDMPFTYIDPFFEIHGSHKNRLK